MLGCVFRLDVPGWPAASRTQLCQPEVLHAFPPTLQLPTTCRESTLRRLVGNTQHVKCAAVALCMAMRKTGAGERQSPGTKAAAHMFLLLKGLDSTTLVVRTQDQFSRLRSNVCHGDCRAGRANRSRANGVRDQQQEQQHQQQQRQQQRRQRQQQ